MSSSDVEKCLDRLKQGKGILLLDDADREDEADVVFLAESITSDDISFMMRECRGLICLAITEQQRLKLELPLQVSVNESVFGTNFAMPFSFVDCPFDGVTAEGRALSIRKAVSAGVTANDFKVPGCVVPVVARDGGVLRRRGQTEGSVDMAKLVSREPAAVICEVLDEDGSVLRGAAVSAFSERFDMPLCTIEDLVQYRVSQESSLRRVTDVEVEDLSLLRNNVLKKVPYSMHVHVHVFIDDVDGSEHFVVLFGDKIPENIPVRVHSECLTGDVFGSLRCDCGEQLELAVNYFCEKGFGALLYLQQEGRGIGLANKLQAYHLQDQGYDTIEANRLLGFGADERDYRVAAQMLQILGISKIDLLTNNPLKLQSMENLGVMVNKRVQIEVPSHAENAEYLKVKANKMGHLLNFPHGNS